MKEIWEDIKGYEGLYQVSNLGRIKSLKYWSNVHNKYYNREIILKQKENRYGYLFVGLYKEHKRKECLIHRLVSEAFIPNLENKKEINHKDGNKKNNCVNNLIWCTRSENMLHAYKTGLRKAIKTAQPVIQYDMNKNFIKKWNNISEIKKQMNFDYSSIYQCCNNKRNKAYNYIWKYGGEAI